MFTEEHAPEIEVYKAQWYAPDGEPITAEQAMRELGIDPLALAGRFDDLPAPTD